MYLGNVSKTSSAKHCVKLFSANLQTAVDWQECLHCFPQNMDSYVMRIIYQNSVVKVAMHFFTIYHIIRKYTGGFLCTHSRNNSDYGYFRIIFCNFIVEKVSCLYFQCLQKCARRIIQCWGQLFPNPDKGGIWNIPSSLLCPLGWSHKIYATFQLKSTWCIY